jgi:hypothetical protein
VIECRKIPGHPLYYAGNDGSLWSRRRPHYGTGPARKMSPATTKDGYLRTSMNEDGKPKPFLAHRLVALAFLGPCPADYTVNHKNGVKTDNRPENLEYVTRVENLRHGYANGLMARGVGRSRAKLDDDKVRDIRRRYAEGSAGMRPMAREYGVSCGVINCVVKCITWKHVGSDSMPAVCK